MDYFLVFPNQLYKDWKPKGNMVLVEEPIFFCAFKVHKLRIAFMRASMKNYAINKKITYLDYDKVNQFMHSLPKDSKINMAYPHDRRILEKYKNIFGDRLTVIEDKFAFVLDNNDLKKCKPRMNSVFGLVKNKLGVLKNTKSQDAMNRKPLPEGFVEKRIEYKNKCYLEAITYANRFKDNPGSAAQVSLLPVSHKDAKKHLESFIKNRFAKFGDFEDAMDYNSIVIYHGNLSYLLNCGLVTVEDVVKAVLKAKVPLNSLEGFLRQVLGWREYMRYIYEVYYQELQKIFVGEERLSESWYKGNTTILPLDTEIKKLQNEAWCHHIIRLMLFLNFFKLAGYKPFAIYTWFMEMVSLDAYEWVMWSNIASMGLYDDRFMSKPYVSGAAYILKMSNYPRGTWCDVWNAMYYKYLTENKKKLVGKHAVLLRNLAYFEKLDKKIQKRILSVSYDK